MNNEELIQKIKELEERIAKLEKEDSYTDDELYEKARELIIKEQKASISYLQRMFRLGYSRACGLIYKLEQDGVIGKREGVKPRKILVKK
jgi:S-DNA-T family DNA segregation ATPase FtsK/SpoIIIE